MKTAPKATLFSLDASKIDWSLLRSQKLWLISNHAQETGDEAAFEAVEGLLNFIDYIQDSAVDQGLANEEEVFGFSSNPTDAQLLAAAQAESEIKV